MFRRIIPYLALFTSFGTLVCCALPALLVTLGLGASLVTLLGNYPQLIWLSEHKAAVFGVAGVLLGCAAFFRWRARGESCPIDPELAPACTRARQISSIAFYTSLGIYGTGAFFAFLAPFLFV